MNGPCRLVFASDPPRLTSELELRFSSLPLSTSPEDFRILLLAIGYDCLQQNVFRGARQGPGLRADASAP
jgi:hypothetical protein